MKKIFIVFPLLLTAALTFLAGVLFGDTVGARLSNLPFFRKFDLLTPRAPIVINTKEEVRVSDGEDVVAAANRVKSKLSAVFTYDGKTAELLGNAVNVSSEGVFATIGSILGGVNVNSLYVKVGDDNLIKISSIVRDPATNVVMLKAAKANSQPASFAVSKDIQSARRVVLVGQLLRSKDYYFAASFVSSSEALTSVASSDRPTRTFGLQQVPGLIPGQVVINLSGDVLGMWDGTNIIPSDILQNISVNYFAHGGNSVVRPFFGFYYHSLTSVESKVRGVPLGAEVVRPLEVPSAVAVGSPAEKGGLRAGDIITSISGTVITEDVLLERLLEKVGVGDEVQLTVVRGTDTINVTIIAGELK